VQQTIRISIALLLWQVAMDRFSTKDEVMNRSGRIGVVVLAMSKKDEPTRYGVIWNDNPTFIEEVEEEGLSLYFMPEKILIVEDHFYKYFAGMCVRWS